MTTGLVLVLVILALLGLLAVGTPVALALAAAGSLGIVLTNGLDVTAATLANVPFSGVSKFALVTVAMFLAMGIAASRTPIAEDTFRVLSRFLRVVPGGLAIAAILACAAFAAVSGSSLATVLAVGRVSIAEMRRYGYSLTLAAGVVGVAGTLGVLIPPSILLVLYGVLTGESIGALIIAGFVPGILSALLYCVWLITVATARPELVRSSAAPDHTTAAAQTPPPDPDLTQETPHQLRRAARGLGGKSRPATEPHVADHPTQSSSAGVYQALVIFGLVIGGIYAGFFTATEAASVGAVLMLTLLIFTESRRGRSVLSSLRTVGAETVSLTGMIFFLLVGSSIFTWYLISARIPQTLSLWVADLDAPPLLVLIVIIIVLIPLGMFLEGASILVVTTPLLYPVVTDLGFDGIWFGILMVKMIEIGLITPPVGLNAYVLAGLQRDLSLTTAFKGILIFYPVEVVFIILIIVFPEIVTFLPSLMRN